MPHTDTRPVRINSEVQRQFAAECKRRGFVIQDKATEALQGKIIEWQAEDEWLADLLSTQPQPQEPTDD